MNATERALLAALRRDIQEPTKEAILDGLIAEHEKPEVLLKHANDDVAYTEALTAELERRAKSKDFVAGWLAARGVAEEYLDAFLRRPR